MRVSVHPFVAEGDEQRGGPGAVAHRRRDGRAAEGGRAACRRRGAARAVRFRARRPRLGRRRRHAPAHQRHARALDRTHAAVGVRRAPDARRHHLGRRRRPRRAICSGVRAAEAASLDVELMREDGRILPVRLLARAVPSGKGLTVAVLNLAGEGASRARGRCGTGARFARFFQSAPFGIAILGPDGRIASANSAFCAWSSTGRAASASLPWRLCAAPPMPTRARPSRRALKRVLSGRARASRPVEITVGAQARSRHPRLHEPVRGRRRRARGGDPLRRRRHRAEGARGEVRAKPEDGGRRQARGRHRARLQQYADGDPRLLRHAA